MPGSRRYPADGPSGDGDRAEILHRHLTLIAEVSRRVPAGYLYRPVWPESDLAAAENDRWRAYGLAWQDWATMEPDDEEDPLVTLAVAPVEWPAPWGRTWLLAAAAWQLTGGVLVAANASWLARPYDGGIDLVPADDRCRADLSSRHVGWRPQRGNL